MTSTGRALAISADVVAVLEHSDLLDAFRSLPRADQIRYGNWIEEGGPERAGRVDSLARIIRIWKKSR